jgi:hypothetical protein
MSEGKPITKIALLPLCYESNTGQFLLPGHFVAPIPPRFTNFLGSEIRAKVFDGGIVRTEGRPGVRAGLSFWNLLNRARFEWKRGRAFQPPGPLQSSVALVERFMTRKPGRRASCLLA